MIPPRDFSPLSPNARLPRSETRRLRVGVELRDASSPTAGGIVVVLVGTLQELFKLRPDVDFVVFCTVFNRELMTVDVPNVETITLPLDDYFRELARQAHSYEIDVLFRGYPTVDTPDFSLGRQIFLIPDIQHEYHPEFFDSYALLSRRIAFRIALDGAGAIMTISEFARQTIKKRGGEDRDVFLARPSLPPEFVAARSDDTTEDERATLPAAPFFLFPANLWPHKNHARLFEAFRRFRERTGSTSELVLTGSPTGWSELHARHPDIPVRHLGYVSAPHLRLLYEHALALTFFSQFEGFGIPVLEAFEIGTPVLCSSTTSLPEVAGDAALTCDPEDVEGISLLLAQIEAEPDLRAELVARGKRRLPRFSWVNAAEQLAGAIQRVHARAEPPALGDHAQAAFGTFSSHGPNWSRHTRKRRIRNRATARRELGWRLLRTPRLLTLVLRWRAGRRALLARVVGREELRAKTPKNVRLRVTGFGPDNRLGDRLEVVMDSREQVRDLRIMGCSLAETTLVVSVNGKHLGRFELRKGERRSLTIQLPPGPRQVVAFTFSDHVIDDKGRPVAFLLEETNVFREEHLHALG
jgi:glycosyltransferase involved in cell wall biosynthesis